MIGASACAHESRPGYLELREVSDGRYEVLWKQPAVGDLVLRLSPVFPDSCTVTGADRQLLPGAMSTRLTLSCPGGLAGKTIRIAGLEDTITTVLVRVYHLDGSEETHLVHPDGSVRNDPRRGRLDRTGAVLPAAGRRAHHAGRGPPAVRAGAAADHQGPLDAG